MKKIRTFFFVIFTILTVHILFSIPILRPWLPGIFIVAIVWSALNLDAGQAYAVAAGVGFWSDLYGGLTFGIYALAGIAAIWIIRAVTGSIISREINPPVYIVFIFSAIIFTRLIVWLASMAISAAGAPIHNDPEFFFNLNLLYVGFGALVFAYPIHILGKTLFRK